MPKEPLETVIKKKVEPALELAMHQFLGVTLPELKEDITSNLAQPLLSFDVDTALQFKPAKLLFKKQYILRLLQKYLGNVSRVAEIARIDRRSVHRLIKECKINIKKIRQEMLKPDYLKEMVVSNVIEHTLDKYKEIIHPKKLHDMYGNVSLLSKNILKDLSEWDLSLKEAEEEFEKQYLSKILKENDFELKLCAKKAGIRYETLYRKCKGFGLI